MQFGFRKVFRMVAFCTVAILCVANGGWAADKQDDELPEFAAVEKFVKDHFAAKPDFRAGDIISKSDVKPIPAGLEEMGWKVADWQQIEAGVPDDGDFIVRQLRSKPGRTYMSQASKIPGGYERLDRISQLPRGKQTVHDLLRAKDGYKLIEYMNETPGGRNLDKQLAQGRRGGNFNKPTNKIYTLDQLVARLKDSHEKAVAASK